MVVIYYFLIGNRVTVAPRVGAWIETIHLSSVMLNPMSRPAWARGLKLIGIPVYRNWEYVAPRVGAWIETSV